MLPRRTAKMVRKLSQFIVWRMAAVFVVACGIAALTARADAFSGPEHELRLSAFWVGMLGTFVGGAIQFAVSWGAVRERLAAVDRRVDERAEAAAGHAVGKHVNEWHRR
jgi:Mn2+/Fe2+ NRAMP family transporter